MCRRFRSFVVAAVAAAAPALLPAAPAAEPPSFEREVAAVLRSRCAGCHRDGDAAGGLSMETFAALSRGGDSGPAFRRGDVAGSLLLQRLDAAGDDHMPPRDQPQPTGRERETLAAWIAAGASPPAADASILATLVAPRFAAAPGPKPVTALAVSPDGVRVAVASGGAITLRAGDADAMEFPGLPRRINALHFSADGTRLVLAGGTAGLVGEAQLRDAATGALVRSFGGHRDLLHDAELSPDGTLLATAGYDRLIRIWDTASGEVRREIGVHTGAVLDLAWHPSGRVLASASADETVKLWRAADGVRLDTLKEPQGEVRAVRFTPDGRHLIAAGRDRRIHLWEIVTLDEPGLNPALLARFAHESPIVALAISADGTRLLASAEDRTLSAWTLPDLSPVAPLPRQGDVAAALVARPRGGFLVGRMDGAIEVLEGALDPVGAAPASAAASPPDSVMVATDARFEGRIDAPGETDLFSFRGRRGETLLLEVEAARRGSKLDSRLEVLDGAGRPVERVLLQATRDSWFTFRGKDSNQSDDFRMHNWREMELDEYLYCGGEVVRLWLYPRGPDSGFKVYPGTGTRQTFFDTTAVTHALGEPAWIVAPLPPGSQPAATGLPVFPLVYANDDAANRRLGTDSQILFTPPADGDYLARVADVRGFGAAAAGEDWHYSLAIRPARPTFTATVGGRDAAISPGSGREIPVSIVRDEGFDGAVRIGVDNLPAGFTFHGPVEIEAGQERAVGLLRAAADAADPDPAADAAVRVTATATIAGREVVQELGTLGDLKLSGPPKLTVEILDAAGAGPSVPGEPLVFRIRPGETIAARVRAVRHDFADRIELGGDDSGRNLPFGCFVDNIGLNGLLIVEGQSEREFFVTASPVARPGRRPFHLRATADGGQCSPPAILEVLPPEVNAARRR